MHSSLVFHPLRGVRLIGAQWAAGAKERVHQMGARDLGPDGQSAGRRAIVAASFRRRGRVGRGEADLGAQQGDGAVAAVGQQAGEVRDVPALEHDKEVVICGVRLRGRA